MFEIFDNKEIGWWLLMFSLEFLLFIVFTSASFNFSRNTSINIDKLIIFVRRGVKIWAKCF